MRRRVLVAMLSVTVIAVALFGIPLAILVERLVDEDATLRVERQAVLAARDVPADFATSGDPVELSPAGDGIELALYDTAGALVSGTGPELADEIVVRALADRVVDVETAGKRIVAVPVTGDERVVGVIRAEQSTGASNARSLRIIALLAGLALGVLAVGASIGFVLAGRLALPVRRLRDAAVQLGDGNFTIDMPHSSVPELEEAATAMTMTARRLEDLVARERAFSAESSHQLRTPLAGLRASIETELEFPRADRNEVLREALVDIDRLEMTITELLTIARTPAAEPAHFDVSDVLSDAARRWHGRFAAVGRPLVIPDAQDTPSVVGNATVLRHALDVLIDNALVHGAGATRVDHHVGAETVTITTSDEGSGFDAESLISPTADVDSTEAGPPHGLGLPLARRLVESMPGRLAITRSGPQPQIDIVLTRADRQDGFRATSGR